MWKHICDALAFERRDAVALRSDLIFYSYGDWTADPAFG